MWSSKLIGKIGLIVENKLLSLQNLSIFKKSVIMSGKNKVLYVCSKLKPYLAEDCESDLCRNLPQAMQENGMEIRTFMPRFGSINERRNQLHEVIRLSGKNIVINDCDHQLVIKVASITSARMQVYFIDNDDYFHRKVELKDENGVFCQDNDERMMFYGRGVLETIIKLQWSPSVIHCNSWFSALVPILVKLTYQGNPLFESSKIVLSLYDEGFDNTFDENFIEKLAEQDIDVKNLENIGAPTYQNIMRFALGYCDGLIVPEEMMDCEVVKTAKELGVDVFCPSKEDFVSSYKEIYDKIINK